MASGGRLRVYDFHESPAPSEDARPVYESAMGKVLYSERADRMFISFCRQPLTSRRSLTMLSASPSTISVVPSRMT